MKLVLACLVLVMLCLPAFGESTGDPNWDYIGGGLATLLDHEHSYVDIDTCSVQAKNKAAYGVGVDVVVYEFDGSIKDWGMDSIEVQNKYDMSVGQYEGYVVAKANLWRPVKKFMGW